MMSAVVGVKLRISQGSSLTNEIVKGFVMEHGWDLEHPVTIGTSPTYKVGTLHEF